MKNRATSDRLKLALKQAGIKATELSGKSGVSKSSISQYINGLYVPSNINAGAMAKVLGVNPLWLMGFEVPMNSYNDVSQNNPINTKRPADPKDSDLEPLLKESQDASGTNCSKNEVPESLSYYIVKKDSVFPDFKKGDILTVDKNADIKSGDYVITGNRLAIYNSALKNISGKIVESRRTF